MGLNVMLIKCGSNRKLWGVRVRVTAQRLKDLNDHRYIKVFLGITTEKRGSATWSKTRRVLWHKK
jgi:hypothetical protein